MFLQLTTMLLILLHTLIFFLEVSALINGKYWKPFSSSIWQAGAKRLRQVFDI